MKVKELIARLQELDPESMVFLSGYEGGLNELSNVEVAVVALNVNTSWYYGKHDMVGALIEHPDEPEYSRRPEDYSQVQGVYIS